MKSMSNERATSINDSTDEREANVKESEIEIIPNRRQLDNKFPVLGFTVKTGGAPYFEVIVTTDKSFFAPDRAVERRAENFFSSRQATGRLQSANSSDAVYIVPASVLNGFANTTPKPSAIYYTLIAYADENGGGAQFAHSPETLSNAAPSVEIAPGFTAQTLSRNLGISFDSLRRVESLAANSFSANSYQPSAFYGGLSASEPDEGEGEDGFALMNALNFSPALENDSEIEAEDGYELNQKQTQTAQSYSRDYSSNGHYALSDSEENYHGNYENRDGDDYEDGFEPQLGTVQNEYSRMQESVFPEGASEPDALYDEEEPDLYGESESYSDWDDNYAAPQSASDYRNSDYEYTGAPAFASNGTKYQTNGHSRQAYHHDHDYTAAQSDDFEEDYGESYGSGAQRARAAEVGECSEDIAGKRRIAAHKKTVETIAKFESGSGAGKYKAINADQEFAAWKWHEAFGKYHIGLSYGIVQFTQDGGSLGKLLKMMRMRDKAFFDKTFGGAKLADELIKVTTASGKFSKDVTGGRSARVQPVDGTDIWLTPWKERFEAAGDHTPFQAAQNELANDEYLEPILSFCQWLGLDTDRAVAMVYDRAVQMGVGGAKSFIIGAVGPISTTALRTQALTALGKKDLKEFQTDFGLETDGKWGPTTHSAMVSALRALGTKSPIPIPTREQMLDSIVRAAKGKDWEHRVVNLRKATVFDDMTFPF